MSATPAPRTRSTPPVASPTSPWRPRCHDLEIPIRSHSPRTLPAPGLLMESPRQRYSGWREITAGLPAKKPANSTYPAIIIARATQALPLSIFLPRSGVGPSVSSPSNLVNARTPRRCSTNWVRKQRYHRLLMIFSFRATTRPTSHSNPPPQATSHNDPDLLGGAVLRLNHKRQASRKAKTPARTSQRTPRQGGFLQNVALSSGTHACASLLQPCGRLPSLPLLFRRPRHTFSPLALDFCTGLVPRNLSNVQRVKLEPEPHFHSCSRCLVHSPPRKRRCQRKPAARDRAD